VEAASRLIDGRGLVGTTLEDVRAEAKVSSSQIYHYFADKQSLILAVIEYQESALVNGYAMFSNFESVAAVRAWGDFLVDQQRHAQAYGGCPIATLGSELAAADGEGFNRVAATFRRCEDRILDGYRTMQSNGDLAADADPGALATVTLATVIGGLVLTQVNRDTRPLAVAIDAVLSGLTSPTPSAARCGRS
jgi:TetR/AcrR family transcriptional regulator, transcriptional repressor for nem operon